MTAAERNAAYEASLTAWCSRIAPVLADGDASRALALAVVGLLLRLLAPTLGSMPAPVAAALKAHHALALKVLTSGGALPCGHAWCPVRDRGCTNHVVDFVAVRRLAWSAGSKAAVQRLPWLETIASCLCRACEDEGLLTRGAEGKVKCPACDGEGGSRQPMSATWSFPCADCHGSGWQPSGPVAPPLLALLLHDAHSLLTELHAGTLDLNDLVNEHVEEARTEAHIRQVHDPLE